MPFPALLLALSLARPQAPANPPADPEVGPWQSLLAPLSPRELGPTIMGGRVADIAVVEKQPRTFFVASASGGLWRTDNGGTTFKPMFDKEGSASMGAVAVQQSNPDVIWIGTGEPSSRNSCAWGDGVYKSVDGGKNWKNVGLKETHQIGRIVIDPKSPNVVYVAALGHLWGANSERGIYKTTDGGKTWAKVLYKDDLTGAVDLVIDPNHPNVLVAAFWQRIRKAYQMTSGGPGSGIYKTFDAGKTWKRITRGLPEGDLGRIGISLFRGDPRRLVATIENKKEGGVYLSTDEGDSWKKVNALNPRPFYFSRPCCDPSDVNRIYLAGISLHYSVDGGKTFRAIRSSVHVDYHALWVDPSDSNHILVGNDGGVGQTRDRGVTWEHLNNLPIGQFYAGTYDMRRPYWVYGGLQDNGSWAYPTQSMRGQTGFWDAMGENDSDGFHVQVDPTDWRTVYWESQGGGIERYDQAKRSGTNLRRNVKGQNLRFNWSTPFIISPHNPRTLYIGSNMLFKTVDRGDHWRMVSPDLTTNNPAQINLGEGPISAVRTGAEQHCTIITISESPMRPGLLWVGTDDGLVQVSQDDGATWTNVTKSIPGLPDGLWCSRVCASRFVEGRAYATFDGHRSDDFHPYVSVTEDFGKTWSSLAAGLPQGDSLYCITEGQQNPDLLYLGSEMSLRFSFDRGKTWSKLRTGFPTVAVHDLVVHPRDLDLIAATHGRSLWTIDVSALEQLTAEARDKDFALLKPQDVLLLGAAENMAWSGDRQHLVPNTQPGTRVFFHSKKDWGEIKLAVTDILGAQVAELKTQCKVGLNVAAWNARNSVGRRVPGGDYKVSVTLSGKEYSTVVHAEAELDPS